MTKTVFLKLCAIASLLAAAPMSANATELNDIKRPAKIKSEGTFVYPEEARRLNHTGVATVAGVVDPRGVLTEARIIDSTNSAILDEAALDFARGFTFKPAKARDGSKTSQPVSIPVTFSPIVLKPARQTRFVPSYPCAAFLADLDWWLDNNPGKDFMDSAIFDSVAAYEMQNYPGGEQQLRMGKNRERFEGKVLSVMMNVENRCRTSPEREFMVDFVDQFNER